MRQVGSPAPLRKALAQPGKQKESLMLLKAEGHQEGSAPAWYQEADQGSLCQASVPTWGEGSQQPLLGRMEAVPPYRARPQSSLLPCCQHCLGFPFLFI